MKKKVKTWVKFTAEEDELIRKMVSLYPTNLQYAFKMVTKELPKRNIKVISNRWYTILKWSNTKVTCGSNAGLSSNVKNTKRKDGIMPPQKLRPFMVVLTAIISLPEKDIKLLKTILAKY